MLHMSREGAADRRRDIWTPVTPQEISPSHSYTAESSSIDISVSAASCPGQASSCQLTCALLLVRQTQHRPLQLFSLSSVGLCYSSAGAALWSQCGVGCRDVGTYLAFSLGRARTQQLAHWQWQ